MSSLVVIFLFTRLCLRFSLVYSESDRRKLKPSRFNVSASEIAYVKKLLVTSLCCLALWSTPASAVYGYADDNPFVEAMLRMMEVFGLIDRGRLPLSTPYMPGFGSSALPAVGTLGLLGAYPGLGGMSGIGGLNPMTGLGMPLTGAGALPGTAMMPGTSMLPGTSMMPGTSVMPGLGGWPGTTGMPYQALNPGAYAQGMQPWAATPQATQSALDGIWELNKGGFVIIRGNRARFYASREKYQDYVLGYDRDYLWWAPESGGSRSRYRYRVQNDRMVLADSERNVLLLRRRR